MTNSTKRPRKPKFDAFTPAKKAKFLECFRITANVTEACERVGISRASAYNHYHEDPEFHAQWCSAEEESTDRLERELWRRCYEGIEEPIHYEGQLVDTKRRFSDGLLQFALKSRRRKKYSDNVSVTANVDVEGDVTFRADDLSDDELAKIAKGEE